MIVTRRVRIEQSSGAQLLMKGGTEYGGLRRSTNGRRSLLSIQADLAAMG
jgi:hypothetical protein